MFTTELAKGISTLTFHDAAPTDWIDPGRTKTVDVDGIPVAIANTGSTFYAFQSLCPHQGTPLGGRPLVDGKFIVCSRHSSKFDVTTGACIEPSSDDGFRQDLMVFPTRVVDDVIQIQI